MGEPLNCPCCDGVAETDSQQPYRNFVTGKLGNAASVYCRECGLTVSHCYADLPDMDRDDVMSMAVEQWNNRAINSHIAAQAEQIAAKDAEIERLRKALEEIAAPLVLNVCSIDPLRASGIRTGYEIAQERAKAALTPQPKDQSHG
ncbi:unnamed protein product [Sphagnum jensenii]